MTEGKVNLSEIFFLCAEKQKQQSKAFNLKVQLRDIEHLLQWDFQEPSETELLIRLDIVLVQSYEIAVFVP